MTFYDFLAAHPWWVTVWLLLIVVFFSARR